MLTIDPPVHPGEYIREEYLRPLRLAPDVLASRLHLSRPAVEGVLAGTDAVTPEMALRLAKLFGTNPQFWMAFQSNYDLAMRAPALEAELATIEAFEHH